LNLRRIFAILLSIRSTYPYLQNVFVFTVEIALLFGIIWVVLVLFVLEVLSTDTVAVSLMVVLMLTGFVSPSEGLAGLSNESTVTVLALMIEIQNNRNRPYFPNRAVTFQAGDVLLLKGSMESITDVREHNGLAVLAEQTTKDDQRLENEEVVLCEVAVLFIFTALLSSIISNNATAILLAPIAVSIAGSLNLDPRPLLFTVMFAANTGYISPIGYQTNTLIYGPDNYRFTDFVKVRGRLTLLIWLLASLVIPYFYF